MPIWIRKGRNSNLIYQSLFEDSVNTEKRKLVQGFLLACHFTTHGRAGGEVLENLKVKTQKGRGGVKGYKTI